jgi:hypothetical protein
VPFERHILRQVALPIVACLIPEGSLHDQLAGSIDQRLQSGLLPESDLPLDRDATAINGNGLVDRFQP